MSVTRLVTYGRLGSGSERTKLNHGPGRKAIAYRLHVGYGRRIRQLDADATRFAVFRDSLRQRRGQAVLVTTHQSLPFLRGTPDSPHASQGIAD